jgi:hypothetical protein
MARSLSDTIIYAGTKDVVKMLPEVEKIDEIDVYGYTPLVQCAIVDSISKAEALLDYGANIDFQDLTGRTALHWAASNDNYDFCALLLNRGADSNSYSYAGQSALVTPLLRHQEKVVKLFFQKGASLDLALDFINAKLLGHRFELEGRADIADAKGNIMEVELEGFYLEFSLEAFINSLVDFRNNFGGKHLRKYFPKLNIIIHALRVASELLKYQHYLIDVDQHRKKIDELINQELLILPLAFTGHAISLIKFGEWLVRCDRGEYGRENGTIIFYQIRNPSLFSKSLIKQLLYQKQYAESINQSLPQYLNLDQKFVLPILPQKAGNCSWANVEAILPALLYLLLFIEKGERGSEKMATEVLSFYNEWQEWDKNRALYFTEQSFRQTSGARAAAKVTLLAAVLFQACQYGNEKDMDKAKKIIPILIAPEYNYVLKSYIEIFGKEINHPLLRNLNNFLDHYGKDFYRFINPK